MGVVVAGRTRLHEDDAAAWAAVSDGFDRHFAARNASFIKVVDAAAAAERAAEVVEPALPVSAGRSISEPLIRTAGATAA